MLIYDNRGIRVYATELGRFAPGGRRDAEKAAVWALLREAFPDGGVELCHKATGAPYLRGGEDVGVEVSVSHCRGLAVMALAPKGVRIGIDCESADRAAQLRRVASRFLSEAELAAGWGASDGKLFLAWTIKEALFKAALDPSLTIGVIPLPEKVPDALAIYGSEVEVAVGGRSYGVFSVASPYAGEVITVVRGI